VSAALVEIELGIARAATIATVACLLGVPNAVLGVPTLDEPMFGPALPPAALFYALAVGLLLVGWAWLLQILDEARRAR
jgi:hypothetical protein